MTVERWLRCMAGVMVLLSTALAYYVSPYWHILTAFVGLNLFQSAFTNWCPAMSLFKALGAPSCQTAAPTVRPPSGIPSA